MADSLDEDLNRWFTTAINIQTSIDASGLGTRTDHDHLALFDALVTHGKLRKATRKLFKDGHFTESVRQGFICLDNAVQSRTSSDRTGNRLMRWAFSADNPRLKLNCLKSGSDRNEQRGYMEIFAGVMTGIRNPRAHDADMADDAKTAVELLSLANHLMRRLDTSIAGNS